MHVSGEVAALASCSFQSRTEITVGSLEVVTLERFISMYRIFNQNMGFVHSRKCVYILEVTIAQCSSHWTLMNFRERKDRLFAHFQYL